VCGSMCVCVRERECVGSSVSVHVSVCECECVCLCTHMCMDVRALCLSASVCATKIDRRRVKEGDKN